MTPKRKQRLGSFGTLVVVSASLFAVGCGGQKGEEVSGTVTMDGEPLAEGTISFLPLGVLHGETLVGEITDGKYVISDVEGPVPGNYRVEFYAPIKSGMKYPAPPPAPPGTFIEMNREGLSPKFNSFSTMTFEVKPGKNEANFALTSDEPIVK